MLIYKILLKGKEAFKSRYLLNKFDRKLNISKYTASDRIFEFLQFI